MSRVGLMILLTVCALAAGCGAPVGSAPPAEAAATSPAPLPAPGSLAPPGPPGDRATPTNREHPSAPAGAESDAAEAHQRVAIDRPPAEPDPTDDARLAAIGIRMLKGEHLTLYTDLPASPQIDRLVPLFDEAFGEWCKYFGVPQLQGEVWRISACLIVDKQKFIAAELFPRDLPPFLHGYFRGQRIWLYDQQDDYYRRHLLLHEGTHAFMTALLGSHGPPWYSEGMAELLATHSLRDGHLVLNTFPAEAGDVPGWGRVRLVEEARGDGRTLTMDDVLAYNARAHMELEPYGWCWAAAALLENHPRYHERFRQMTSKVGDPQFNERLRELFAADWRELCEEWQLFTAELDYGYDFERAAIDFRPGGPLPASGATVTIAADRGWQSTGVTLEAGKSYRLRASGEFQVAAKPNSWTSQPDGVTVRYSDGHPLGMLLAAVHPEPFDPHATSTLLAPQAIGADGTIRPVATGTLYLRVNDSPAELADNAGKIEVRVAEE